VTGEKNRGGKNRSAKGIKKETAVCTLSLLWGEYQGASQEKNGRKKGQIGKLRERGDSHKFSEIFVKKGDYWGRGKEQAGEGQ